MNHPTNSNKLKEALQRAIDSGNKRAIYRIAGMRVSLCPAKRKDGRPTANPGWLYVKDDDYNYLGKIAPDGSLQLAKSIVLEPEQKASLLSATHNPEQTAMQHGKETGTCCCCGRTLTNPLSVELGIGPICRGGWFPSSEAVAPVDLLDLGLEELGEPVQDQLPMVSKEAANLMKAEQEAELEINDIVEAFTRLNLCDRITCIQSLATILGTSKDTTGGTEL